MTQPQVHDTITALRTHTTPDRRNGKRIALVPTMGALHDGHLSLVRAAQAACDHVIVSIFVNPTQFAPNEDFDAYPRDTQTDIDKLASLSVDTVFLPKVEEIYPSGFATSVTVAGPSAGLESETRPHFFDGVALVVTKLLLATQPDIAVFGEKDYQQLCVVRQFVRDLNIPVEIHGAPTVRERDGLAMSSRNRYLTPDDRARAAALPRCLRDAVTAIEAGADVPATCASATEDLIAGGFVVDYLELRDATTLTPVDMRTSNARLLVAARLGKTRLIDNMAVVLPQQS